VVKNTHRRATVRPRTSADKRLEMNAVTRCTVGSPTKAGLIAVVTARL